MAITSILLTLHALGYVYLWDEWRYYRSHNAILASFQFIGIPTGLLIIGNLIAPDGLSPGLIGFTLDVFGGIFASSSLVSLILLVPVMSIFRLTARYYDDRYSGFVFRNRRFGPLKVPLLIHFISVIFIVFLGDLTGRYDVIGFGFVVGSVIQWTQKLLYPGISSRIEEARYNRQAERRNRRGYMSSILSNTPSRTRRDGSGSSGNSGSSVSATNTRSQTNPSGQRRRAISTTPSSGYREIPTRSRNAREIPSRSRNTSQTPQRRPPSRPAAEIDRGVDVNQGTKEKKVKTSKIKQYLPSGSFDSSDLKCIVCYDEFSTSSTQNIVICPECKFPGHEVEFMAWLNTSPRCPRCNKEINSTGKLRSKTVSESQYAKFIKKI